MEQNEVDTKMQAESESKRKVDLDTILIEEIGQFGKFQLRTFILAAITGISVAVGGTGFLFTAARINTRCLIPECDGDQPEWSPRWLPNAVPASGPNSFDNCRRFGNTTVLSRLVENDTICPSALFDRGTLQDCDEYVYETKDTITYEFDLACNEWARTLIGTVRTVGSLIALPIVGYISDRWGRRVALCITAFNTAWIGVTRYWANSYVSFIVSEFMEDLLGSGNYTSAYILMMELLGPKFRTGAGAAMNSFFSLGQILMGLTAWGLRYWRHLILAFYVPQLLTIFYYFLISESVRWYMSKGRFAESEALLKKAARVNGRQLSDESLEALRHNTVEEARKRALQNEATEGEWLIVTVFKHKRVLLHFLVAPVWWITTTFVCYGLSINAVNMSGNRYLNFIAVAAVEIPGHWFSVYLLTKMGRKPVLILSFWCCATCQLAYVFLPQGFYGLSLAVYLIAQFCIAVEMVAVYIYTAELYPTVKRQSLFSITLMIGRLGSMVAPLTPAFGAQWFEKLPFMLFAGLALLSGALVFITPETRGIKLPDTFEQAEDIGCNNNENKR